MHLPASGSVAIVRSTCSAKSASVRVASTVGAITRSVAASTFAVGHGVPWRTDSCSRRSTRPGLTGNVSAARSTACMPVFSSTQIVRIPCVLRRSGAFAYVSHTSRTCRRNSGASLSLALSQYALRCGRRAAVF